VKKKSKNPTNNLNSLSSEEVRLELLNLAILFRSQMIEKEEFQSKARSMGIMDAPESILRQIPVLDLG
jgi:hypothetical protein